MSDVEADAPEVPEQVEEETKAGPPKAGMSVEDALQQVLKNAMIADGLARGLKESVKALDSERGLLCVLNESCTEKEYLKLIEALANQRKVNLIKVSDPKVLGTWAGLCKIDREGQPRKIVGCSCVVVVQYGEDSEGLNVLLDHLSKR